MLVLLLMSAFCFGFGVFAWWRDQHLNNGVLFNNGWWMWTGTVFFLVGGMFTFAATAPIDNVGMMLGTEFVHIFR